MIDVNRNFVFNYLPEKLIVDDRLWNKNIKAKNMIFVFFVPTYKCSSTIGCIVRNSLTGLSGR
jgi:hypothetical protein